MGQNEDYLRLLSIFYYVLGGMTALFSCFPLFHLLAGIFALLAGAIEGEPLGVVIGIFFVVFSVGIMTLGWAVAALLIVAGSSIAHRRRYTFCLVIAAIACTMMPFGTALGVFTIIVLMRPEVKQMFEAPAA
ncbi:MAG: hypothetical protein R6V05_07350 [Candidatus Brocadiia bacterium]